MADRITWSSYPVPARGFGPHQVNVYMAAVYVNGDALDLVACTTPRSATEEAKRLARHYAELAGAEVRRD